MDVKQRFISNIMQHKFLALDPIQSIIPLPTDYNFVLQIVHEPKLI